jgi:glycosyltransferase involved in cell wall biosynthesis
MPKISILMEEAINEDPEPANSKICFLSTYPPKECGIATFTQDLSSAMNRKFNPRLKSQIIALNDDASFYNYNKNVVMEINKDDIDDYINKAKEINQSKEIKLVCIQHEFGIFGGEYGNHLIPFLELIEKPVVTTFHSVLPNPDKARKRIVKSLCEKSSAVVVMARKAVEILKNDYEIDENKLHFIPHGIPSVPFLPQETFKNNLNLNNKIVLSTFGLLSKGKGIEYIIRALPKLVEKYPNILYLIIGETHPVVRKEEGEKYRKELMQEIRELGLKNNVKFYNKFLTLQEIIECLLATDIYICTNLDKNQIVSGTLSYAMGCGRTIVSTPTAYAKEFLAKDRGVIAEERNPESYIEKIDNVLSSPELKRTIERNAYTYTRSMTWQNVAINYLKVFNKALKLKDEIIDEFPEIKLDHLINMTDDFGMIQFANNTTPDINSGYTIDDNSRALITTILHDKIFDSPKSLNFAKIYLNFIEHCQHQSGNFQNNIENENQIIDSHSEDSLGRTIWALGYTINKSEEQDILEKSEKLITKALSHLEEIKSPRAVAFSIIGLYHYNKKIPKPETQALIKTLADYLTECYRRECGEDWHWFEEILSYSNSKLPEALYLAYETTKNQEYLDIAEKSLNFLTELIFIEDKLCLIGQNGWCKKNGKRAFFDQQPVDASSLVHTFLTAHSITNNKKYYEKAIISFNWFFGKNHLNQIVYDETTGGCFDGIGEHSLNLNQGAESTLSYLTARLFIEEAKKFSKII